MGQGARDRHGGTPREQAQAVGPGQATGIEPRDGRLGPPVELLENHAAPGRLGRAEEAPVTAAEAGVIGLVRG